MFTSLMTTRRFLPLFLCQFFAAFGDNFLKTALVFVILFQVSGGNSAALITLAGATLILPFFFLFLPFSAFSASFFATSAVKGFFL